MQLTKQEIAEMINIRSEVIDTDINGSQMYWNFKLFHEEADRLEALCDSLPQEYSFIINSPKRNRVPDYEVEGWVCRVGLISQLGCDGFSDLLKRLNQHINKFEGEIIELGPDAVPKRIAKQSNWRERWKKSIETEKRKLSKPAPYISSPEIDNFDTKNLDSHSNSPALKLCDFTLKGTSIFITDMQPGPTENGISVALQPGHYRAELCQNFSDGYAINQWLQLVLKDADYSPGGYLGTVSTDLAKVGFYDERRLRACFHHDCDSLFSWGCHAMTRPYPQTPDLEYQDRDYGVLIYDLKRGYIIPYATSGVGDGTYPVLELFKDEKRIGFRIELGTKQF